MNEHNSMKIKTTSWPSRDNTTHPRVDAIRTADYREVSRIMGILRGLNTKRRPSPWPKQA